MLLNISVAGGQRHAFFGYCKIFVELLLIFTLLRSKTNPSLLESETALLASQTLETAKEAVCSWCPLLLLQGKPCFVEADPSLIISAFHRYRTRAVRVPRARIAA